jgi:hypothetical protein
LPLPPTFIARADEVIEYRDLPRVMAAGCAAFCATTGLLLNEVATKIESSLTILPVNMPGLLACSEEVLKTHLKKFVFFYPTRAQLDEVLTGRIMSVWVHTT